MNSVYGIKQGTMDQAVRWPIYKEGSMNFLGDKRAGKI